MNQHIDPKQEHEYHQEPYLESEEEISLLDYLVVISKNLKFIVITTLVVTMLGVIYALLSKPEYTSTAQVIREVGTESAGNASLAALRGFGLNLGGASTGLNPETIPDILRSREVVLAVARDDFKFPDEDSLMSYVDYVSREGKLMGKIVGIIKKYTIGLPGTLIGLFKKDNELAILDSKTGEITILSKEEVDAIESLKNMLDVNVDMESGLMTLSMTTIDPLLSAMIANSFIDHLTQRVREIYTQKSRDNVDFIRDRFVEVEAELTKVEDELAKFVDSNMRPSEQQLQVEITRLQRKVSFKSQLYQELQSQLTQAEIELQKADPVLTIIDEPVPPLKKSGPNRKMIVVLAFFLGGGLSLGVVFVREYVGNLEQDDETRGKIDDITSDFGDFWNIVKQLIIR